MITFKKINCVNNAKMLWYNHNIRLKEPRKTEEANNNEYRKLKAQELSEARCAMGTKYCSIIDDNCKMNECIHFDKGTNIEEAYNGLHIYTIQPKCKLWKS